VDGSRFACSDCSLAVNRCDSEMRSTSTAMASTAASIFSSRALIVESSRGGTGRGSNHLVIRRTMGKPRTMVTMPGITQENTSLTMKFGSGGIRRSARAGRSGLTALRNQQFGVSLRSSDGKRIARFARSAQDHCILKGRIS